MLATIRELGALPESGGRRRERGIKLGTGAGTERKKGGGAAFFTTCPQTAQHWDLHSALLSSAVSKTRVDAKATRTCLHDFAVQANCAHSWLLTTSAALWGATCLAIALFSDRAKQGQHHTWTQPTLRSRRTGASCSHAGGS